MSAKAIKLIANPTTSPPDKNKPYIAVDVDGEEKWFLLSDDATDVTDADFDFDKGKKAAAKKAKKATE